MSALLILGTRYNTIEKFNVDSKAKCIQLNLAHIARKIYKKKKLKQTNAIAHLVQYRFKVREGCLEGIRGLWRKGFVKEMSFKTGVKGRGSDRW